MLGGRTNHWGRISLRFGPDDFRGKSIDGLGDDWPIGYDDIAPYYDRVDRLVGIFGSNEGLPNHPDGIFLPPPKPRCYELLVKQARDKLDITCIPARLSILTQPLNGRAPLPLLRPVRPRLHRRTRTSRRPTCCIPPALRDRPAHARHQRDGARGDGRRGRPRDRRVVRRQGDRRRRARPGARRRARGERLRVRAHPAQLEVVALPAGARQLRAAWWASTSPTPPAPTSPASSRRWWTTSRTTATASAAATSTCRGGWTTRSSTSRAATTSRCGAASACRRTASWAASSAIRRGGGYGEQLKDDYRRYYGATIGFAGRGELIPNEDCYCELDPTWWTAAASRCCASTGSGPTTSSTR